MSAKYSTGAWKGVKWLREPVFNADGEQTASGIGIDPVTGRHGEYPDPCPLAVPLGEARGPDPLRAMLKQLVDDRMVQFLQGQGEEEFDSPDDAEDFDVEDDMFPVDPHTPYEAVFDPPPESSPSVGGVAGNSPQAASEAVKGENRAPEDAAPPPVASQTVSADSVSASSAAKKVETPTEQAGIDAALPPSQSSKRSSRRGSRM